MAKISRVKRQKTEKKSTRTKKGGYDVSFRATGDRPQSKTEQNAKYNTRRK